jgi:hypothetical protein
MALAGGFNLDTGAGSTSSSNSIRNSSDPSGERLFVRGEKEDINSEKSQAVTRHVDNLL